MSNIGGALTPLGDPPLFLGFLKGVSFFWTTTHLFSEMLVCAIVLLGLFYAIDSYWYRKEGRPKPDPTPETPVRIEGGVNIVLLASIVGGGAGQRYLESRHPVHRLPRHARTAERPARPDPGGDLLPVATPHLPGLAPRQRLQLGPHARSRQAVRRHLHHHRPALAILRAGKDGALAPLVALVTGPDGQPNDVWYFWLTGILSSFLDNAPTYLVFFNLAGGDPTVLMGALASTLAAISCGAVFMGANSYIGNAPNFMVKAVVEEAGIRMPSFFGYMAWSCGILLPLFVLLTVIFF